MTFKSTIKTYTCTQTYKKQVFAAAGAVFAAAGADFAAAGPVFAAASADFPAAGADLAAAGAFFSRAFKKSARIDVLMLAKDRADKLEQSSLFIMQIRWLWREQWPFKVRNKIVLAECAIYCSKR